VESSHECSNGPSISIKCWEVPSGYTTGGLFSSAQFHTFSLVIGVRVLLEG
jgi:hypothetical protein